MTGRHWRLGAAGIALTVGLGLVSACSGGGQSASFVDGGVPAGSFQLVAFDTCDSALRGLRAAARSLVGPYGFGGGGGVAAMERGAVPAPQAGAATDKSTSSAGTGTAPNYSGTNTHEAGVDEPDLVKTDGRRIVTMTGGVLRVVDAASKRITGLLDLVPQDGLAAYAPVSADLLLAGDHALVLMNSGMFYGVGGKGIQPPVVVEDRGTVPRGAPDATPPGQDEIQGPRLVLVDISGSPRVLSEYAIDGGLVDARQVGSTARVVIRSFPRLVFPYLEKATDADRITANRKIIDRAPLETWLPRIETTTGDSTDRVKVSCEAISRPATYTGTNLLTIVTFDLGADRLGRGDPTTVVADGETVYSNGPSLYIASDRRWQAVPMPRVGDPQAQVKPAEARTEIYRFDTSKPGRPRYVAGGSVPGYLINQYAMSEWDGRLRVATTTEPPWNASGERRGATQSGVYVLSADRRNLKQIGKVEGLGKGERIYAVRFYGVVGYVVTFRQTDPLYTIDLRDPAHPSVLGELKITGYSSYLHPIEGDKLIGIGQEATGRGRPTGTQVSLFDLSDLAQPRRMAHYQVSGAHSEAEFDPHAFLYWAREGLLVVPLQVYNAGSGPGAVPPDTGTGGGTGGGSAGSATAPSTLVPRFDQGALILLVDGGNITEVGFIVHPYRAVDANYGYPAAIRRSLVIDETLWTFSDGGLMATDLHTLNRLAWIPFA